MPYKPLAEFIESNKSSDYNPPKEPILNDIPISPIENLDRWNSIKKDLEISSLVPEYFPKKAEVWMVILGQNLGFEQNGVGEKFLRPMLVIHKFNNHMFWCVPLSSKQKRFDFYFNFIDQENQNVSAVLAQLRLVSVKRFQRKMYEMPWGTFDAIKNSVRKFLD